MREPAQRPGDPKPRTAHAGSMVVLAVLLAAAWLLWSGLFKPLLLGLGLVSCALVLVISKRMHLFDTDILELRFVRNQ